MTLPDRPAPANTGEAPLLGVATLDAGGRIQRADAGFCRLLRRTEAQLAGLKLAELTDTDALLTGEGAAQPAWFNLADGTQRVAEVTAVRNAHGWTLVCADLARCQQTERQNRVYEAVISNTPDFIYMIGLDRRFIYANDALLTMWGRTPDTALGRTLLELGYEPWHADMHHREIEEVLATRRSIRGVVPFTGTHGRRIYDYIFSPVFDPGGEITAIAGITRDITEQEEARIALRRSEERIAVSLEASEFVGTWDWDLASGLVVSDERFARMYSVDPVQAASGAPVEEFTRHIHPADLPRIEASIRRVLENGGDFSEEYRLSQPGGSQRWIVARGRAKRDESGKPVRLPGVAIDITERKRLQAIAESQKFALELAVHGGSLEMILQVLVRAVEDNTDGNVRAAILLVDPASGLLCHGASYNLPEAFGAGVNAPAIRPPGGQGAKYSGDKAADRLATGLWESVKNLGAAHGLESCACVPILSAQDMLLGAFALYYPAPHVLASGERELVDYASRTAGMLIERERELSARLETERLLRENEQRVRLIIDTALDAVVMTDSTGIVTEWNKPAEQVFGWTREEAIGRQMADMIIPEAYREAHLAGMNRYVTTGEHRILGRRIEITALNKAGWVFPIELTVTAQRFGGQMHFTAFARDITQRIESERAVREAREHLSLMVESARDYAIISLDLGGRIVSWNAGAERIFGYKSDQAIGQSFAMIFTPEDCANDVPRSELAVAGAKGRASDERWHMRAGGKRFYASGTVAAMYDEARQPRGFIKIARDMTEQQQAQQALIEARNAAEAANIAKTEFLANMSHEIRTPMNAVIGLSNILATSRPLTRQQEEFIRTLQMSADSLLALINDLLDIAKIEARTVDLERVPFSLTRVMQEIISMMGVRIREKGLTFTGEGECVERRLFMGDPTRLRQIILNLCSNAIKFTEVGGVHIRITCEPQDDANVERICIAVEDTGIGIEEDKLQTIFHKFVQADSSINRKYGGTGLGLAITKTLVEIMGGSLSVESSPGRGSVFTVCLPLEVADVQDVQNANASLAEIFKKTLPVELRIRRRILLVEDYMPNVLVASTFLEQFGYDCDVAQNGLEAIDRLQEASYAAILMDVQMHGMNGLEATILIRRQETQKGRARLPIIGMTAHALSGDRERCLAAGMDDYISKPFNPGELKEKLERLLG